MNTPCAAARIDWSSARKDPKPCLAIFPLGTVGCSSPSTTATRSAIFTSRTSDRRTTPAPGRAGSGSTPTCPASAAGQLVWTNDHSWTIRQRYLRDTLTTSVALDNRDLRVAMYCNDVVDFHRNILVARSSSRTSGPSERVIRVIHHQDFNMFGTKVGDTAYFDPELRSIVPLPRQALPDGDLLQRRRAAHRRYRDRHQRFPRRRRNLARRRGRAICKATPSRRARSTARWRTTCTSRPTASARSTW
jgi:hypothetical protein